MSFLAIPRPRPRLPALQVDDRVLDLNRKVVVMGIVNVTPDSFSDGGSFYSPEDAVAHGISLWEAGADILDVGGESTRPGAEPVDEDEELRRVIPVIEALARETSAWISVDTYKSEVARKAAAAGAHIVNDISGLGFDPQMASVVAETGRALVLMHIRKTPKNMQQGITYEDLLEDLKSYFRERVRRATDAGIPRSRILLDPGIGFGKTVDQNYRLLRELSTFTSAGYPLLIGTSRKSFIGAVVDRPAPERVFGTAATVACAVFAGANVVRVHDVEEMVDVVRVTEALCGIDPFDDDA